MNNNSTLIHGLSRRYLRHIYCHTQVSFNRLAKWQWRWVLLADNGILDDSLDQYGEEWRLALIKGRISPPIKKRTKTVGPSSMHSNLSLPDAYVTETESINSYSLTPTFGVRRQGFKRVKKLVLQINGGDRALSVGTSIFSTEDLKPADLSLEEARQELSRLMFPPVYETYKNMQGRQLVVAANQNEPFFKVSNPNCRFGPAGSCNPVEGIDYNLINFLGNALNFRYCFNTSINASSAFERLLPRIAT
jgi:hypothetical protein